MNPIVKIVAFSALLILLAGLPPGARAQQKPCCTILSINSRTAVVTGEAGATGQTFEFRVADPILLSTLRRGQSIYANFAAKMVSLDGKKACCPILSATAPRPAPALPTGNRPPDAPPASPNPAGASAQSGKAGQQKPTTQQPPSSSNTDKLNTDTSQINAAEPNTTATAIRGATAAPSPGGPAPCCTVVSLDKSAGTVAVREESSGRTFEMRPDDPRLMAEMHPGQGVYANFRTNQASLDGKTACCKIVGLLSAVNSALAPAQAARAPAAQTGSPAKPMAGQAGSLGGSGLNSYSLPQISAGAPQSVDTAAQRLGRGSFPGRGNRVGGNMLQLRGMADIQKATSLPEGARELLLMHARTLGAGELDDYIVNPQLAEEWMKTHPAPASAKAATSGNSHTGCKSISIHCAEEAGQHAVDEASRQSEKLLKQAREEWQHVTDEATHDWHMTAGCFEDHQLTLPDIPVRFSVVPEISLDAEKSGTTSNKYGSASGTVHGTVSYGIPVDADFKARLDLFYIPCLPFAVRPRSLAADGSLVSGSRIGATLTATGEFGQHFMIPPSGGPHFPIEIIPIVIAGVPVAEMDVSVYVDGTLDLDGEGRLDSTFTLEARQKTNFDFACSGKGCNLRSHSAPLPNTASEAVKLQGRLHVKPAVYVALQLDFDVDLLSARAGPQPYLLGELYGCGAASAAQTQGGSSTSQQFYALTADLDWGIELRSEALVANKIVAEAPRIQLVPADKKHLYFKDLANSTALIPSLAGTLQPAAGQPASYKTKMPDCYPYTDPVEYRVNWTGGATAINSSSSKTSRDGKPAATAAIALSGKNSSPAASEAPNACTIQPGQGDCWSNPLKDVSLDLDWPAAGAYSLTVTPVRDKHGRDFSLEKAAELSVTVQP